MVKVGFERSWRRPSNDFGNNSADAPPRQPDSAGSPCGEVENATSDKRSSIIDRDDNAAALEGDLHFGAER